MKERHRARSHLEGQMRHLFDDARNPAPKGSDSGVDVRILPVAFYDPVGFDADDPVTFRISRFDDAPWHVRNQQWTSTVTCNDQRGGLHPHKESDLRVRPRQLSCS